MAHISNSKNQILIHRFGQTWSQNTEEVLEFM